MQICSHYFIDLKITIQMILKYLNNFVKYISVI